MQYEIMFSPDGYVCLIDFIKKMSALYNLFIIIDQRLVDIID